MAFFGGAVSDVLFVKVAGTPVIETPKAACAGQGEAQTAPKQSITACSSARKLEAFQGYLAPSLIAATVLLSLKMVSYQARCICFPRHGPLRALKVDLLGILSQAGLQLTPTAQIGELDQAEQTESSRELKGFVAHSFSTIQPDLQREAAWTSRFPARPSGRCVCNVDHHHHHQHHHHDHHHHFFYSYYY